MKHLRSASVLLFSLVIMGMISLLTQQLIKSVSVGVFFTSSMVAREQAEMVALGGINCAIAQLQKGLAPQKKDGREQRKKGFDFTAFITRILPHLGRKRVFELTREHDGVDATLWTCITVEEGKVPTALLYDKKKKELSALGKALFKNFSIKKVVPSGAFLQHATQFYKKNHHPITDVSHLAPLSDHFSLPLYYHPPEERSVRRRRADDELVSLPAVQDMFSTWHAGKKISPLFLSDGVCALLGLRRPEQGDAQKRIGRYKQLAERYEGLSQKSGEVMWKGLEVLYDVKPRLSKELQGLFSLKIEPRFYSVLSCAAVRGVKQTVLALLESVGAKKGDAKKKKPDTHHSNGRSEGSDRPQFVIRRLYWL